jgi:hypothetical protein
MDEDAANELGMEIAIEVFLSVQAKDRPRVATSLIPISGFA